jgi:hypothetical protein
MAQPPQHMSGDFEVFDPGSDGELDADGYVREAIQIVSHAKSMPLSASVLVSRDELLGVLERAIERMPNELREARWLLKEREEFLAERSREAEALMEEVRAQAERMVSRTEIVRQANQVAQRILDGANEEARRLRHETEDYCDQKLAGMEIVLERVMRTVSSGREKLQAISPPQGVSEPVTLAPIGQESTEEEDGFFDQDVE